MCIPCSASLEEFIAPERVKELLQNRWQSDRGDLQSPISHPVVSQLTVPKSSSFSKSVSISHVFSSFSTEIKQAWHSGILFERTQTKNFRFRSNNSCCYEFCPTEGWSSTRTHFLPLWNLKSTAKDYEVISSEIIDLWKVHSYRMCTVWNKFVAKLSTLECS